MLKKTFFALTLPLLVLLVVAASLCRGAFGSSPASQTARSPQRASSAVATAPVTGTLQKMIVENGSVTVDLDLNGLDGSDSLVARPATLQFAIGGNSFFPILVFNDLLRGLEPGSMTLVPVAGIGDAGINASRTAGYSLPAALSASFQRLVIEKLPSAQGFDLAVRDGKTGFTFFNVEGHQYDYDPAAQSLTITNGRLLISKEFAKKLGRRSDAGATVGKISIGAAMQTIEINHLDANGNVKSASLPAMRQPSVGTVPGPDVIVGDLIDFEQSDPNAVNGQVGLALGTDACNQGTVDVDWIALPSNDHPFIPQNLYRMSGGADNTQTIEQIGQSWGKHAFAAASANDCGFGCNGVGGQHLGSGCSDAYGGGLNGDQNGIGSRAWVNPFTGNFPSGNTSNDHTGHVHDATSHRILVNVDDLNTSLNQGATYFTEAQYIVPHEGTWCQSHPDQCNMYNNASYRQCSVSGINPPFSFNFVGNTVREQPAIMAWTGASVTQLQPDAGNDGIWFMGYKVTGPNAGIWHYEYALYDQNLDRSIQSFSVPLGPGVNITNIDFHAPPQHPGFANDNIPGGNGYSSTPWTVTQTSDSITWNCETFAQNQAANAIRFGTLYNFRFDADQGPNFTGAAVGFFKTGSPMEAVIQAPGAVPPASPTPTATPTATATPTPTPTATPCDTGIIQNEGFETGNFSQWTIDGTQLPPVITTAEAHSGTFSALAGGDGTPSGGCGNGTEPTGDSSFYQQFTVPAAGGLLSFWHQDCTTDSISFDWQDAYITDSSGNILQTIFHLCDTTDGWVNQQVDMTSYANQTVRIKFLVHQDGAGDLTGMYVDDVVLYQPCGTPSPTPTPTATATATVTPTATPNPTPTPTPSSSPTPPPTATPRATPRSRPTPHARPTPR